MRAVVSRVLEASARVDGELVGALTEPGLLVLLGVTHGDAAQHAATMARKLHELRLLRDERSCAETGAGLLVVSQFTLYAATRTGRRPSFTAAAPPDQAETLVEEVVRQLRARGAPVVTGRFGAAMAIHSVNDGPYTVLVETSGGHLTKE